MTNRWEELFRDLQGQAQAVLAAEQLGEIKELAQAECAAVTLSDRLRAAIGSVVCIELSGGEHVTGQVRRVAHTWVLLQGNGTRGPGEHLIPLAAVVAVTSLTRHSLPSKQATDTLGMGNVLRRLQQERCNLVVKTAGGHFSGRLQAVGKDHFDLESVDRTRAQTYAVAFSSLLRVSQA